LFALGLVRVTFDLKDLRTAAIYSTNTILLHKLAPLPCPFHFTATVISIIFFKGTVCDDCTKQCSKIASSSIHPSYLHTPRVPASGSYSFVSAENYWQFVNIAYVKKSYFVSSLKHFVSSLKATLHCEVFVLLVPRRCLETSYSKFLE